VPVSLTPEQQASVSKVAKTITVPAGLKSGELFEVKLDGERYTFAVPPGKQPGDSYEVSIPSKTEVATLLESSDQKNSKPVQVPEGKKPGDTFDMKINGSKYTLTVPPGKYPGDTFTVYLNSLGAPIATKETTDLTPSSAIPPLETVPLKNTKPVQVPEGKFPGDQFDLKIDGSRYTLTVPVGKAPGDSFLVDVNALSSSPSSETLANYPPLPDASAVSPPSVSPSSSSSTSAVVQPPAASLPVSPPPVQPSQAELPVDTPQKQQFTIKVPEGMQPGQAFTVQINGMSLNLNVPTGKNPGDLFTINVSAPPKQPTPEPVTTPEAPPVAAAPSQESSSLATQPVAPPVQAPAKESPPMSVPETVAEPSPSSTSAPKTASPPAPELPPDSAPQQFTIQVPDGLQAGQTFNVQIQGISLTLTVPNGKQGGDSFGISLQIPSKTTPSTQELPTSVSAAPEPPTLPPSSPSISESAPSVGSSQPDSVPTTKKFSIQVPEGKVSGQTFNVEIEGMPLTLTVPDNKKSGDVFTIALQLPPAKTETQTQQNVPVTADTKANEVDNAQTVVTATNKISASIPPPVEPEKPQSSEGTEFVRAELRLKSIEVPEGKKAGDTFDMKLDGKKYTFTIPEGKSPGQTFMVDMNNPDLTGAIKDDSTAAEASVSQGAPTAPDFTAASVTEAAQTAAPPIPTVDSTTSLAPSPSSQQSTASIPDKMPQPSSTPVTQPSSSPTEPQKFTIQVPEGKLPGDTFSVQIQGIPLSLTVPSGKNPGDTFTIALQLPSAGPSAQSSPDSTPSSPASTPSSPASTPSAQPSPASIPNTKQAPPPSSVSEPVTQPPTQTEPQKFSIQVPEGKLPGDTFSVQIQGIPLQLTVPSGKNPGDVFNIALQLPATKSVATPPESAGNSAGAPATQSAQSSSSLTSEVAKTSMPSTPEPLPSSSSLPTPTENLNPPSQAEVAKVAPTITEMPVLQKSAPAAASQPAAEPTVAASAEPKRAELRLKSVTIPDGLKDGDSFDVKLDGKKYTLTVPKGKRAGQSFMVDLDSPELSGVAPAASAAPAVKDQLEEAVKNMKYIEVPPGKYPGDEFEATIDRIKYTLAVPKGKKPGESFAVDLNTLQAPVKNLPTLPPISSKTSPAPEKAQSDPAATTQQYTITVPDGLTSGQSFNAQVGGMTLALTVPPGKGPGDTFAIALQAPASAPVAPDFQQELQKATAMFSQELSQEKSVVGPTLLTMMSLKSVPKQADEWTVLYLEDLPQLIALNDEEEEISELEDKANEVSTSESTQEISVLEDKANEVSTSETTQDISGEEEKANEFSTSESTQEISEKEETANEFSTSESTQEISEEVEKANEFSTSESTQENKYQPSFGPIGLKEAVAAEDLAAGWQCFEDPQSKSAFYWNEATGEAYQATIDEAYGIYYYWNPATSVASYSIPPNLVKQVKENSVFDFGKPSQDEDLPEGWTGLNDLASGRTYYWNKATNEVTWTRPTKSQEQNTEEVVEEVQNEEQGKLSEESLDHAEDLEDTSIENAQGADVTIQTDAEVPAPESLQEDSPSVEKELQVIERKEEGNGISSAEEFQADERTQDVTEADKPDEITQDDAPSFAKAVEVEENLQEKNSRPSVEEIIASETAFFVASAKSKKQTSVSSPKDISPAHTSMKVQSDLEKLHTLLETSRHESHVASLLNEFKKKSDFSYQKSDLPFQFTMLNAIPPRQRLRQRSGGEAIFSPISLVSSHPMLAAIMAAICTVALLVAFFSKLIRRATFEPL